MTRIGVVGPQYPDSFADNVASALGTMGLHPVRLGAPQPRATNRVVGATSVALFRHVGALDLRWQRRLLEHALRQQCTAVISVDHSLHPEVVAALRRSGIRVALWFPDAISNLDRQLMFVAPYHHLFLKEPVLVRRVRDLLGLPVTYLPEACNPLWHRPQPGVPHLSAVVVAGNMYPTRTLLLQRLLDDGVPLRLHGPPPPRFSPRNTVLKGFTGAYVAREEKARLFRSAAAVLNNLHPAELEGVNARLFEAAGSGAAVVTEERAALRDLFEPDHEVLTFRTYEELVARLRMLLGNPADALALGDRASRRARVDHTYENRLRTLLTELL